jgi:hypothetical protein
MWSSLMESDHLAARQLIDLPTDVHLHPPLQRRRRSSTAWPARLDPIVVFAFVGPRPVVRASALTTVFEMAAASSPVPH